MHLLLFCNGFASAGGIWTAPDLRLTGMGTTKLGADDESQGSSGDLAGIDMDNDP